MDCITTTSHREEILLFASLYLYKIQSKLYVKVVFSNCKFSETYSLCILSFFFVCILALYRIMIKIVESKERRQCKNRPCCHNTKGQSQLNHYYFSTQFAISCLYLYTQFVLMHCAVKYIESFCNRSFTLFNNLLILLQKLRYVMLIFKYKICSYA